MTQFVCIHRSNEHLQVCSLSLGHGVAELPEEIGAFVNDEGQVIEIRRTPTGPTSYSGSGDAAHYQQQIRDIVQNYFWATATFPLNVDQPLALADGRIYRAKNAEAVVRVKLKSFAEFPDFVAHMSILKALHEFLGVQSDAAMLCEIASAMTVEEGMCLPVTDETENTLIMKVRSPTKKPGCFNVTFYGSCECTMSFQTGQVISRVATWKERGSAELHLIRSDIGEVV